MSNLIIHGKKSLNGDVKISGSKNEVLKIIASSVCLKGTLYLKNTPHISDVDVMLEILSRHGAKFKFAGETLELNCENMDNGPIDDKLAARLRASIVLIGPYLARFKRIKICYPGGDMIGARSIETHLKAFSDLGATVVKNSEFVELSLENLKSKEITLSEKSVTATENIILYASSISDEIIINNCAIEPEILHLCDFLRKCGASITQNDRQFKVSGSSDLAACEFRAMPDRIEAGTYICAFLSTGGAGRLVDADPKSMEVILDLFKSIGANITADEDNIEIQVSQNLKPFSISTGVFPDFPSDMQAPLSVLASQVAGTSRIEENLYRNRFGHLAELEKLGLQFKIIDDNHAEIYGVSNLHGARINVCDLRSGATAVLAGLVADGQTTVCGIEIIERGYENIDQKLKLLGAQIKKT